MNYENYFHKPRIDSYMQFSRMLSTFNSLSIIFIEINSVIENLNFSEIKTWISKSVPMQHFHWKFLYNFLRILAIFL